MYNFFLNCQVRYQGKQEGKVISEFLEQNSYYRAVKSGH